MSVYEQRLADDKRAIRERVAAVGNRVGEAVAEAVAALLARDVGRCHELVLADLPVNREIRAIDTLCHSFVARHLPSAGHLRFVSSVLQMNVALERVGDYAVTICREGIQLSAAVPGPLAERLEQTAKLACEILGQSVLAFSEREEELARKTKGRATPVGRAYGQIVDELSAHGQSLSFRDALALTTVFHRISRVGDQAKNLCEETLFELTGETKPPKQYGVLFVDREGALLAPLAAAIARKAFPNSGAYSTAGVHPAQQLDSRLGNLSDRLGLRVAELSPERLPTDKALLVKFHVVVNLGGADAAAHIPLPYSTVLLNWELPDFGSSEGDQESVVQALSTKLKDLMTLLRGEGAS